MPPMIDADDVLAKANFGFKEFLIKDDSLATNHGSLLSRYLTDAVYTLIKTKKPATTIPWSS